MTKQSKSWPFDDHTATISLLGCRQKNTTTYHGFMSIQNDLDRVPFLWPVGRSILDFLESFRSDRIRFTGSQSPYAFDIFWPLFTCISQHLSTILCPDQRRSCSSVSLPPRENGNSAYRAQTLIKTFDMLGMVDHAKVRAWTINIYESCESSYVHDRPRSFEFMVPWQCGKKCPWRQRCHRHQCQEPDKSQGCAKIRSREFETLLARSQWKQWKLEESEKRCEMLQTHPADKLFILYIIIHFTPVQHLSLRSLIEESSNWQCHNLSNTATKISTAISLNICEHLWTS